MMSLNTITASTLVLLLLAACSSTPINTEKSAASDSGKSVLPDERTVATATAPATDPLNDSKGLLAQRNVYFAFDSDAVTEEYNPMLSGHASYLTGGKERKILIQGNTDARGGSEYNLALGQKRAEAVRKGLVLRGVPDDRIEAVSLGKEKPKALGSDEVSWAENRRADILYNPPSR